MQFSDEHPKETEELWSTLCGCWPNNLKVIIRYLIIVSGMAPQELLPYVRYSLIVKGDIKNGQILEVIGIDKLSLLRSPSPFKRTF